MSEPVRPDDRGAHVRDLHRRLLAVGHPVDAVEESDSHFGPDTTRALLAFQAERGLDEHGTVDETTQAALVEAGVRLGDRHLYLHAPMFRGDDVADLQLRLGNLGFDAGRIDGIFGPDTAGALSDFQRNVGLAVDGIAGSETVLGLRQLLGRAVGRADPGRTGTGIGPPAAKKPRPSGPAPSHRTVRELRCPDLGTRQNPAGSGSPCPGTRPPGRDHSGHYCE